MGNVMSELLLDWEDSDSVVEVVKSVLVELDWKEVEVAISILLEEGLEASVMYLVELVPMTEVSLGPLDDGDSEELVVLGIIDVEDNAESLETLGDAMRESVIVVGLNTDDFELCTEKSEELTQPSSSEVEIAILLVILGLLLVLSILNLKYFIVLLELAYISCRSKQGTLSVMLSQCSILKSMSRSGSTAGNSSPCLMLKRGSAYSYCLVRL